MSEDADLDMDAAGVRSLAKKTRSVAEPLAPAAMILWCGWLPTSSPDFKAPLFWCRKVWPAALTKLGATANSVGDNLNASANAAGSADSDAADQF